MSYPPPPPSVPPPPPLGAGETETRVPPAAWLVPVAAVLAVIGVFTPWFKPQISGTYRGRTQSGAAVKDALYSWKEGRLGLVAPIVLVLLAVGVVSLLRGRRTRFHRGSTGPVVNAALGAIIAGVVSIAAVAATYMLLPSLYKFTDGSRDYSWNELIALVRSQGVGDVELSQGPQAGRWLTAAAGVVAIVAGVTMLVTRDRPQPSTPPVPPAAPGCGVDPPDLTKH